MTTLITGVDFAFVPTTNFEVASARRSAFKRRWSRWLERTVVNRINRAMLRSGRFGSTYAVLETTGRRTGRPRQIPVANGLQGDIFWLISAHGRHAHYVHNLLADPRVRMGTPKGDRDGSHDDPDRP